MNFHGEKRGNQTHESKTDPEAKLARKGKGKEAKLSYSGNLLVENRNGLIVDALAWEATGRAERDTALLMLEQMPGDHRLTVGGDKGFDIREFVSECRQMRVTPHVALPFQESTWRFGMRWPERVECRWSPCWAASRASTEAEEILAWALLLSRSRSDEVIKVGFSS